METDVNEAPMAVVKWNNGAEITLNTCASWQNILYIKDDAANTSIFYKVYFNNSPIIDTNSLTSDSNYNAYGGFSVKLANGQLSSVPSLINMSILIHDIIAYYYETLYGIDSSRSLYSYNNGNWTNLNYKVSDYVVNKNGIALYLTPEGKMYGLAGGTATEITIPSGVTIISGSGDGTGDGTSPSSGMSEEEAQGIINDLNATLDSLDEKLTQLTSKAKTILKKKSSLRVYQ